MKKTMFLIILILSFSIQQAFAVDAAALYSFRCAGCHGKDGNTSPALNANAIAGMSEQEVLNASQRFLDTKNAKGLVLVMQGILKKLSENERKELAKYIANDL